MIPRQRGPGIVVGQDVVGRMPQPRPGGRSTLTEPNAVAKTAPSEDEPGAYTCN